MKNKTHKYNIIKKHGKGNIASSIYTIEYQVDGLPQRYITDVYCLGSKNRIGRFAWLEGMQTPFIVTKSDKDNFMNELALYQKGSSYRKNNPIKYSDVEILNDKRDKLYQELNALDKQIKDKIQEETDIKLKLYREESSKEYNKNAINELDNLLNNFTYDIYPVCDINIDYHFYDGIYLKSKKTNKVIALFIYDKHKNKYRLVDVPDKLLLKII